MNHYGPRLRPIRGDLHRSQRSGSRAALPLKCRCRLRRTRQTSSQVFLHVRHVDPATPNVAGRQVKLPEREGNTSHTVPAPYQTVAVVLAGMVHVP
jgi:hypothetical protein